MARVTIAHSPELTAERAEELFRSHFAGRYEVYQPTGFERFWNGRPHFVVKGPRRATVAVWLVQAENTTQFAFRWAMPLIILLPVLIIGFLTGFIFLPVVYLVAWLILRRGGKAIEEDLKSFMETAGFR